MACSHPKSIRVFSLESRGERTPGWRVNEKGQVLCLLCNRVIGSVSLNEFGRATANTKDAKRARTAFQVSTRPIDISPR